MGDGVQPSRTPRVRPRGDRRPSARAVPPFSLGRVVAYALLVTLAFAIVAPVLMLVRNFHPLPAGAGTTVLAALLIRYWTRAVPQEDPARRLGGASPLLRVALGALLLASGISGLIFSSEHVETDRDPGVYVNAGRWLAEHGTLLVDPAVDGFADATVNPLDVEVEEDPPLFTSAGYYGHAHRFGLPEDQLYPRFFHTFSAFLAVGDWVGGHAWLVRVNALIGAVALLMVFAFAARVTRPWLALGAAAALAVNLAQVYFQRDAFTEPLTQLFLFGGLWALWEASRHLRVGRGVIAGLALGATCLVRVDSFLFLVPLAVALVVHALRARRRSRWYPRHRRFVVAVASGTGLTAGLGLLQGLLLSPPYVLEFRRPLAAVAAALVVVLVGGSFMVHRPDLLRSVRDRLLRARRPTGVAAVSAILGGALIAYGLRPELDVGLASSPNGFVESLQAQAGVSRNGYRNYAELSMRWLGWYLGPVGLAAGVLGWARGWWGAVGGRIPRMLPFLFVFSLTTFFYVGRPMITPDQVWAMRRFLPVTIPGFFVLAFWTAGWLWVDRPRRGRLRRGGAALIAAGTLAFSTWTLAGVPTAHGQRTLPVIGDLCRRLPEGSGVIVAHDDQLHLRLTQTLRGFCGTPAAYLPSSTPIERYRRLAARWEEGGGSLFLLSTNEEPTGLGSLESQLVASVSYEELERRLFGRPASHEPATLRLYLSRL